MALLANELVLLRNREQGLFATPLALLPPLPDPCF
jgi:hypothetical protein